MYRKAIYLSRRYTSADEIPRQAMVHPRPWVCVQSRAYIGADKLEAASWELDTRVGELQAAKGENIMWLIGGGFMFSGLLIGALSGSVALCLGIIGFGMVLIGCHYAQEQYKERQSQAWRKNYPSYRY